jgi:two-component system, NtrC family, response regulator AtoC
MRLAHENYPPAMLLGNSPAIHRVYEQIRRAAKTEVPVLITGESGTGKEVTARLLHDLGARRSHTFLRVNCPAIPSQLFESELFGHEAGAFTGAKGARSGKFEQADKGTLFLDEIGELDLNLQSKLLHALQDFRVARLGGLEERVVDLRLVCATNRELEDEVAHGTFRADLFYRVNVLRIDMPPLRERPTDVPILMNHFIKLYSERFGCAPGPMSPSFMKLLELYHWPGNVREMQNMAKRYVVLGTEEHVLSALRERDNPGYLLPGRVDLTTPLRLQTKRAVLNIERQIILNVLEANKWNRTKTARSLNISYRALLYKIKEAGLPPIRAGKTDTAVATRNDHEPQLDIAQGAEQ